MSDSWKAVAIALGERMANHAYCPDHPAGAAKRSCPFCRDRAAYDRFLRCLAAHGLAMSDPLGLAGARAVPLREVEPSGLEQRPIP